MALRTSFTAAARHGARRRGASSKDAGWATVTTVAVCLVALSLIAPAGADDEDPAIVDILNVQFEPSETRVPVGTTVRWVNHDPFTHDVTSGVSILGREARRAEKTKLPDGKFSSGLFAKDQTFSHTFSTPGEYPYFCNIHPFMVGKIVVE